ncbi:hypothetical protein GGI12_003347 [Dipsacomyces acuminosporus]|nr:hypothetical protein GGI12_003347 [Dipsacomyces acuminosporus]
MHQHMRVEGRGHSRFDLINKVTRWIANLGARNLAKMAFGDGYVDQVRDKMLQVVLTSTAEAINNGDYEALDQLMTPFLSKLYKHAIANMRAQGFKVNISLEDLYNPEVVDFIVKMGPPEAYDLAIPYGLRSKKYAYKTTGGMDIAVEKMYAEDGTRLDHVKPPTPVLKDWLRFECLFKISANVSVEMTKKGKVIDSDQGSMEIPVTLCTPFYEGIETMANAFQKGEGSEDLEPFRWRVCDLLNIVEHNELVQLADSKRK